MFRRHLLFMFLLVAALADAQSRAGAEPFELEGSAWVKIVPSPGTGSATSEEADSLVLRVACGVDGLEPPEVLRIRASTGLRVDPRGSLEFVEVTEDSSGKSITVHCVEPGLHSVEAELAARDSAGRTHYAVTRLTVTCGPSGTTAGPELGNRVWTTVVEQTYRTFRDKLISPSALGESGLVRPPGRGEPARVLSIPEARCDCVLDRVEAVVFIAAIDDTGNLIVAIPMGLPAPAVRRAADQALRDTKFEPARLDGRPVADLLRVRILVR